MKKLFVILLATMMLTASLAACSGNNKAQTDLGTQSASGEATTAAKASAQQTTETAASTATKLTQSDEVTTTANVTSNGAIDATDLFSDRDLRQTADLSEAVYYDLSDNSNITTTTAHLPQST